MTEPLARVIALSPFESPDPRLVIAAARAGALGVLDLGRDEPRALAALHRLVPEPDLEFGVRIPEGVEFDPQRLPANVRTIVLPAGRDLAPYEGRRRLVQVTSVD